ncbi:MAG: hypothetical protein XE11_0593 [Methanomicrobiales archaeon 53_19]|nr:MAG: hypothetical protein XE11_0593 [Methanomicrobiales archaeon 53_19]
MCGIGVVCIFKDDIVQIELLCAEEIHNGWNIFVHQFMSVVRENDATALKKMVIRTIAFLKLSQILMDTEWIYGTFHLNYFI